MGIGDFILEQAKNINNVYQKASEVGKQFADKELKEENLRLRGKISAAKDILALCVAHQEPCDTTERLKKAIATLED